MNGRDNDSDYSNRPMSFMSVARELGRVVRPAVLTAALATISLAACGSSGPGPASVVIRADVSSSNGSAEVRKGYLAAAVSQARAFYGRGGALRIDVFAGSPHGVELISADLESGLGDVARARQVVPLRASVEQGLSEALGVKAPRPEIARAIDGLTRGSDVAGNLAAAIDSVRGRPNPRVVLLTDGGDSRFKDSMSPREMYAAIRPLLPADAGGISVSLLGIGGTRDGGASAEKTDRLVEVWTRACRRTGANCRISQDIHPGGES